MPNLDNFMLKEIHLVLLWTSLTSLQSAIIITKIFSDSPNRDKRGGGRMGEEGEEVGPSTFHNLPQQSPYSWSSDTWGWKPGVSNKTPRLWWQDLSGKVLSKTSLTNSPFRRNLKFLQTTKDIPSLQTF